MFWALKQFNKRMLLLEEEKSWNVETNVLRQTLSTISVQEGGGRTGKSDESVVRRDKYREEMGKSTAESRLRKTGRMSAIINGWKADVPCSEEQNVVVVRERQTLKQTLTPAQQELSSLNVQKQSWEHSSCRKNIHHTKPKIGKLMKLKTIVVVFSWHSKGLMVMFQALECLLVVLYFVIIVLVRL